MKSENIFAYSSTNKRYHTIDYFYKKRYSHKVYRISLDASFSCPNRNGNLNNYGCYFCAFTPKSNNDSLRVQLEKQKKHYLSKKADAKFLLYFQAGSTGFPILGSLEEEIFSLLDEDILGVILATRPDIIDDEFLNFSLRIKQKTDLYIELGLQTTFDETANSFNRGYSFSTFLTALEEIRSKKIEVGVHLINGLPGETAEMMIENALILGKLDIQMIKFHYLTIVKGSYWGDRGYLPPLLSKDEFVDIIIKQLMILPPHIAIGRLTADNENMIAPIWGKGKIDVLNSIDKQMAKMNIFQGQDLVTIDDFIHIEIIKRIRKRLHAVDATAGNGKDLLFLAGIFDKVTAIDIQELAINRCQEKIKNIHNVELFQDDFINISKYITKDTSLIIYNLGFLPGSNHQITTSTKSKESLEKAIITLPPESYIFITAYTRHRGGYQELIAIKQLVERYQSLITATLINSKNTFIIIRKH